MKRSVVLLALLALLLGLLSGCEDSGTSTPAQTGQSVAEQDTATQETTTTEQAGTQVKVFTLEELAVCNGQNGNPAYVAVDGVVYDVTTSQHWHGGHHHDCPLDCMAGQDLSEEIKQAPARMRASLQQFPAVGTLAP